MTPKRARWKQAPEKNSELLSENGKRQIQNQCQHVFFANMKKCQAWFDMKCDINDIHMQKMGTFSFQPPVFGMFVDETSLLSWRRSRLSRQSRIVWDRPWRSWGLGWCAVFPLAALFFTAFHGSSTVNLTDTIRFQGNTALTFKGSLPFLPSSWNHVENWGP